MEAGLRARPPAEARGRYTTAMKWWGWGLDSVAFTHDDKPDLAPFIEAELGVDVRRAAVSPPSIGDIDVPGPALPDDLRDALAEAVGAEHVSVETLDRVVHARGKS